jgi:hypothetical protein
MTLVSLELATSNDRPSRHDPTAHAGTIDAAGPPS